MASVIVVHLWAEILAHDSILSKQIMNNIMNLKFFENLNEILSKQKKMK